MASVCYMGKSSYETTTKKGCASMRHMRYVAEFLLALAKKGNTRLSLVIKVMDRNGNRFVSPSKIGKHLSEESDTQHDTYIILHIIHGFT